MKDIAWPMMPEGVKEYLQFQANERPECPWAEGLCIKYHSLSLVAYVFKSEERATEDRMEATWQSIVTDAGGEVSMVTPQAVIQWITDRLPGDKESRERLLEATEGATA
tara:strand:+ start:662 stop:988 length:327 start_codon:yes stop_codon:yes gene_type:complete